MERGAAGGRRGRRLTVLPTRGALVALALLAVPAGGCLQPPAGARREPAASARARWADADWAVLEATVRRAAAERLDTLPVGTAVARIARGFVGAPYRPGTLEEPGPEHLVINLREFDCVTLVEHVLALTAFARRDGVALLADRDAAERRYAGYLTALRYRGGVIAGYPSRLHYFSEWLSANAAAGRLRLVTRELGGVEVREPLDFMTTHRASYPALADSATFAAIAAIERRLGAGPPRVELPEGRIAGAEPGIREGDVIAATAAIAGLDVVHTGFAVREGGRVHLLHAPLVGKSVEISALPLADRIAGIGTQDGIMVARPMPGWFTPAR